MNPRKVDVATEADWSWFTDPDAVKAVERAAWKAVHEFEDGSVEYDDAYQDASLWLAVHPGLVDKYRDRPGANDWRDLLAYRIYSDALREAAISESDRRFVTVSREGLEEDYGWEF